MRRSAWGWVVAVSGVDPGVTAEHGPAIADPAAARRSSTGDVAVVLGVDAVEGADVQVDVDIQAGAKALHERHGARVSFARSAAFFRASAVVASERFGEDARQGTQDVRLGRGEERQVEREAQDVLADRHGRNDGVDEVGGLGGHAPAGAARAESAALARKGDEEIVPAICTPQMDEAAREVAAAQVTTKRRT